MSGIEAALLILILAACGGSVPPETVESLSASPERLKELRREGKTGRSRLGDGRCNRMAEATSRRFLGCGNTPYTPSNGPPKF